jgi:hypothetical protein
VGQYGSVTTHKARWTSNLCLSSGGRRRLDSSDTENESEVSTERITSPRSIYAVTATEPADFFEEYWQTQEYVGDHQFEDYGDWFCEDYNAYDADQDDSAGDNDDRDVNATDSDDEQVFRLGD